jgi:hypothetical protein
MVTHELSLDLTYAVVFLRSLNLDTLTISWQGSRELV